MEVVVGVAVGVGASAPAEAGRLELALVEAVEQRGELEQFDVGDDLRLAQLRLVGFGKLDPLGAVGHQHGEREAVRLAALAQLLPHRVVVLLVGRDAGVEGPGTRRDRRLARLAGVEEDNLVDPVAVERVGDGLAQRLVVERRLAVMQRDVGKAEAGHVAEDERPILLGRLDILAGDLVDQLQLVRLQAGQALGRLGDRLVGHLVEIRQPLLPVVRVLLDRHVIAPDPLDEAERTGADRLARQVGPLLGQCLGGDDHPGAVGEGR